MEERRVSFAAEPPRPGRAQKPRWSKGKADAWRWWDPGTKEAAKNLPIEEALTLGGSRRRPSSLYCVQDFADFADFSRTRLSAQRTRCELLLRKCVPNDISQLLEGTVYREQHTWVLQL